MEIRKKQCQQHARIQTKEDLVLLEEVIDGVSLSGATIPSHIIYFLNKSIKKYKVNVMFREGKSTSSQKCHKERRDLPQLPSSQIYEVYYW